MVNFGNSCYFNAVVSALSNCFGMSSFFLRNKFNNVIGPHNREKNEFIFTMNYVKVLIGLFETNQTVSPKTMYNNFFKLTDMEKGRQNDAHECLLNILNIIHIGMEHKLTDFQIGPIDDTVHRQIVNSRKAWISEFKKGYSIVNDTFFGQYIQKIRCVSCKHSSFKYEPFIDIGLCVTKPSHTIYELLENNFTGSMVELECEKCKEKKSTKTIRMIKLPKYLIINFKKFTNNCLKLNSNILFESSLDVSDYCLPINNNVNYNLVSVINHFGDSSNGHYYTYNRTFNGEWVKIDDDTTSKIEAIDVCTKDAYILIYEQALI
jgi:ubiquitin C-terminal hydrolase